MDTMHSPSGPPSLDEKSHAAKEISCLVCLGRDGVHVRCILISKAQTPGKSKTRFVVMYR